MNAYTLNWHGGANPGAINGLPVDVNTTVGLNVGTNKDVAIIGDFANMVKWGYAKQIPLEVIRYGDPDNSGKDLKGYNQSLSSCRNLSWMGEFWTKIALLVL